MLRSTRTLLILAGVLVISGFFVTLDAAEHARADEPLPATANNHSFGPVAQTISNPPGVVDDDSVLLQATPTPRTGPQKDRAGRPGPTGRTTRSDRRAQDEWFYRQRAFPQSQVPAGAVERSRLA